MLGSNNFEFHRLNRKLHKHDVPEARINRIKNRGVKSGSVNAKSTSPAIINFRSHPQGNNNFGTQFLLNSIGANGPAFQQHQQYRGYTHQAFQH